MLKLSEVVSLSKQQEGATLSRRKLYKTTPERVRGNTAYADTSC